MRTTDFLDLTDREIEILQLVGEGYNSQEIADMCQLSPGTVCTHRKNILRKTGAKNLISVVILAVQRRVINVHVQLMPQITVLAA